MWDILCEPIILWPLASTTEMLSRGSVRSPLMVLVFFATFALFSRLTALVVVRAGGEASTCVAAGAFVLTFVPIALAYHLAYYLSYTKGMKF